MEPANYRRSDPLIHLLNEIDILLAQARLTELYFKQARAAAGEEIEQTHRRYQAALAVLRAELEEKERALVKRDGQLQNARHESAAHQERANQLEFLQKQTERLLSAQGDQIRQRFLSESEQLDARLKDRTRELDALRAKAAAEKKYLTTKISQLEHQSAENQSLLVGRDAEINRLKERAASLSEPLARLESASKDNARDQYTRQNEFSENAIKEISPVESRVSAEKRNGTTNF